LQLAAENEIHIGIETELLSSLSRTRGNARSSNLGIYYDVGNATAAGHQAKIDLGLAPHLSNPPEDRRRGG
jgi:hypothetical protein